LKITCAWPATHEKRVSPKIEMAPSSVIKFIVAPEFRAISTVPSSKRKIAGRIALEQNKGFLAELDHLRMGNDAREGIVV